MKNGYVIYHYDDINKGYGEAGIAGIVFSDRADLSDKEIYALAIEQGIIQESCHWIVYGVRPMNADDVKDIINQYRHFEKLYNIIKEA